MKEYTRSDRAIGGSLKFLHKLAASKDGPYGLDFTISDSVELVM